MASNDLAETQQPSLSQITGPYWLLRVGSPDCCPDKSTKQSRDIQWHRGPLSSWNNRSQGSIGKEGRKAWICEWGSHAWCRDAERSEFSTVCKAMSSFIHNVTLVKILPNCLWCVNFMSTVMLLNVSKWRALMEGQIPLVLDITHQVSSGKGLPWWVTSSWFWLTIYYLLYIVSSNSKETLLKVLTIYVCKDQSNNVTLVLIIRVSNWELHSKPSPSSAMFFLDLRLLSSSCYRMHIAHKERLQLRKGISEVFSEAQRPLQMMNVHICIAHQWKFKIKKTL